MLKPLANVVTMRSNRMQLAVYLAAPLHLHVQERNAGASDYTFACQHASL